MCRTSEGTDGDWLQRFCFWERREDGAMRREAIKRGSLGIQREVEDN
jgi:hypothetical protein